MGEHGIHRTLVGLRPACLVALTTLPSLGSAQECRLALALAVDVSSSVDEHEDRLQRSGLAAALISPEVEAAFFADRLPVALAVYEWSGRYNQELLIDWQLVENPENLLHVAQKIGQSKRSQRDFPTAIGYALGYGAGLLSRGPDCLFRTLDMAGDGVNNEGFMPESAYAEFPFAGVTVNGLVIGADSTEDGKILTDFYRDQVLHGAGAFLVLADGFEDFERAMRRKLERELSPRVLGGLNPRRPDAPG